MIDELELKVLELEARTAELEARSRKLRLMGKAEGLMELGHWIKARNSREPMRVLEDLLTEIEIRVTKLKEAIER
jgi:hypothetical protein